MAQARPGDINIVRQYDMSHGPNYTDNPFNLGAKELALSEDMVWDGYLKTIPGASRLTSTVFPGTNTTLRGMYHYVKKNGNAYFVVVSGQGKMMYENAGGWTSIATGLSTNTLTYWDWVSFNDTMIACSGKNNPKKWDGTTFADVAGSPPKARFVTQHVADYLFMAGHTSNPSQIRYSDTATHAVWPVGNTLEIGRNEGQIITGLQKFGDATVVFKENSIWTVSGTTPTDFSLHPTPSEVGCIAPNSITLTDSGIFFWSEAGPAIFNGFRTQLLGHRIRSVLDTVDWANTQKITAAYYPYKKHLLVSYPRTGQTYNDRFILFDMSKSTEGAPSGIAWPCPVAGFTTSTTAKDSTGRKRAYLGFSNGFVCAYDSGTTFNTLNPAPRFQTRWVTLGEPDIVVGVRDVTVRSVARTGNIRVKYSANGNSTFTTHPSTPYSTAKTGYQLHQKVLQGDGSGSYIPGNAIQLEFGTTATTGFELYGYEVGLEKFSRREVTS